MQISIKSMKLKETTVEVFNTKKRNLNTLDQTESNSSNLWKILIALLVAFIIIILFIFCYRYLYWKIIHTCKRCLTWRIKESNTDDNFPIVNENETVSCTRRRFFWTNRCNFSKFQTKSNIQRNKECKNECKLKTLLQEKKKLLASTEDKILTNNSTMDLTRRLSLKMSFSSFLSPAIETKEIYNKKSSKQDIKDPEEYKSSQLNSNVENFNQNLQKKIDICFSDTDVKLLITPKKSGILKEDIALCKWNSGNIDDYYKDTTNTSSKLIDLKYENTESLSDSLTKYEKFNPMSNYSASSLLSRSLSRNKTVPNRSDILSNVVLNKLQRTSNLHFSSTSANSSVHNIKNEYTPNNIDMENHFQEFSKSNVNGAVCTIDTSTIPKTDGFKETKSPYWQSVKFKNKVKSSLDVQSNYLKDDSNNFGNTKSQLKNTRNSRRIRSDGNFTNEIASFGINYEDVKKHFIIQEDFTSVPKRIAYNVEETLEQLNHDSETSETHDELGILFSQYMKLQARPCQRKYCSLSRHLKHTSQHSEQKCQTRFNYYRMYPYDQRPACNSGNVCTDTYDEFKLMGTSPSERKNIYRCMFKRRKQFLNQPCVSSFQNFPFRK